MIESETRDAQVDGSLQYIFINTCSCFVKVYQLHNLLDINFLTFFSHCHQIRK